MLVVVVVVVAAAGRYQFITMLICYFNRLLVSRDVVTISKRFVLLLLFGRRGAARRLDVIITFGTKNDLCSGGPTFPAGPGVERKKSDSRCIRF